MTEPLDYAAGCDRCGRLATWHATPDTITTVGAVSVECPARDGGVPAESHPEPQPYYQSERLSALPVAITRLVLWRMLQSAFNRRAA